MPRGAANGNEPSLSQFGPLKEPTKTPLFQVFISHAGRQKRGFVDFLEAEFRQSYPAVRVFVDEHSLVPGEDAIKSLHAKLGDADVVVLVLSEEFITTPFPMEELHLLLERRRTHPESQAVILPVFYDVTSVDVHAMALEYRQAAAGTMPCADAAARPGWALTAAVEPQSEGRSAALREQYADDLQDLAGITGIRTDQAANARGTELVQMIARQAAGALLALNKFPAIKSQVLPPVLINVGANKRRILQVLALARGKPAVLLLHGMGGIGKTTLAKAVFNELHGRDRAVPCCFLEIGPDIRDFSALLPGQSKLLQELACGSKLELSDTSEALRLMEEKLEGRRVLVVVDSVWRDQLEHLLPVSVLKVLGQGSVVLVTSRDRDAAAHLRSLRFAEDDTAGIHLVEEEVECMAPGQSLELFCWHAIGLTSSLEVERDMQCCSAAVQHWRAASSTGCGSATLKWLVEEVRQVKSLAWDSSSAQLQLQLFVERCGGLPMALDLLGRHLAKLQPGNESRQFFACAEESFPLVYGGFGLFQALKYSWKCLELGDQKDYMLDIAWFLQRRSWGLVECYSKEGVLAKLLRLGLVQKCLAEGGGSGQPAVAVHPVMADYCKLGSKEGKQQLRQECHQDDDSCPNALEPLHLDTLKAIMNTSPVGLSLRGWLLDADACKELSRGSELRVLQMQCQVEPMPLALSAATMSWLGVEGAGDASELRLELRAIRTTGSQPAGVIVLEHSATLQHIKFRAVKPRMHQPKLKGLWITECQGLELADLSGLAALQQLRIAGCERLQEVVGLDCLSGLDVLELSGCSEQVVKSCLATSPSLTKITLTSCHSAIGLPSLRQQPLVQELRVENCANLMKAGLQPLGHLTSLEVRGCQRLQEVQLPTCLKKLLVENCVALERVVGLAHPTMAPTQPDPSPGLQPSPQVVLPPIRPPTSPHIHGACCAPCRPPSTPPRSPQASTDASQLLPEPTAAFALALTEVAISGCPQLLPLPCLSHLQRLEKCTYHLGGGGAHDHPHRQAGPGSHAPFTWERPRGHRGASPAACPCQPDQKALFSTPRTRR